MRTNSTPQPNIGGVLDNLNSQAPARLLEVPTTRSHVPDPDRLRVRIGSLLRRGEPVSEEELREATEALDRIVNADDPCAYVARYRCFFPDTLAPLVLFHLGVAWAEGDDQLADSLQVIHACLVPVSHQEVRFNWN